MMTGSSILGMPFNASGLPLSTAQSTGSGSAASSASPLGAGSSLFSSLGLGSAQSSGNSSGGSASGTDPLAQLGLSSMSTDTQTLFLSIQTMMVGVMGIVASVLQSVLKDLQSGAAGASSSGGASGNASLTSSQSANNQAPSDGGTPNITGDPVGDTKTPPDGTYGGHKLSGEQLKNAAIIANVGKQMGMSKKDIAVALATAMGESSLKNLNYGDRDSVGLFQQRPSCGWGTVAECEDPVHAATRFFEALKKQGNRDTRSVTDIAHAVQGNADPNYYTQFASVGTDLVNAIYS